MTFLKSNSYHSRASRTREEHNRDNIPVEFGQSRARSSNRISLSQFIVRVWILNICVLLSRSGRPNSTLRSNLPGRSSAGSSVSGLKNVQPTQNMQVDRWLEDVPFYTLVQGKNIKEKEDEQSQSHVYTHTCKKKKIKEGYQQKNDKSSLRNTTMCYVMCLSTAVVYRSIDRTNENWRMSPENKRPRP